MNTLKVPAFLVSQPIGDFFAARISAEDLVKISRSDVRSLSNQSDVETYLGIQRPLNRNRAREIQEYVVNVDASFPSSIILSIEEKYLEWNEDKCELVISYNENESPAKILDGQHRIAGFMDIDTGAPLAEQCRFEGEEGESDFELLISILVGLDITEQATVFGTVNIKQTKVSKSLVYDLEAYSKARSPQKTAHDIVVALDQHKGSPFHGKIKRLGMKAADGEVLTQAALVEQIIDLITTNAMKDRDILLRQTKGFNFSKRSELERAPNDGDMIFRNQFIDEKDNEILKVILYFFVAVQKKWPTLWASNSSILTKTVGISGLFRVMKILCLQARVIDPDASLEASYFSDLMKKSTLGDSDIAKFPAKSSSTRELAEALLKSLSSENKK